MPLINKDKVIFSELSYKLTGLFFETQNTLGRLRSEKSYADYLEQILKRENILFKRETPIDPSFKGECLRRNIPDFIIEDKVIIDLKAKNFITKEDYYQMKRYLASSKKRLGILVNFRQKYLSIKRVALGF
jgi:GxxExxY protein